jgi:hypothetical protein
MCEFVLKIVVPGIPVIPGIFYILLLLLHLLHHYTIYNNKTKFPNAFTIYNILIFRHERIAGRELTDGSCNNIFGEFKVD